ncbi:hypothetical protein ACWXWU_20780 [Shewanella sp. A14]
MNNSNNIESIKLEVGEERIIQVNAPVEAELKTNSGSIIRVTITPNNPLRITSQGDIIEVNINVTENSIKPLSAI